MPGTFVRICASTAMNPRSTRTPAVSRPMSSTIGARPTATSTRSTSIVCDLPFFSCTVSFTPCLPTLAFSSRAPVSTSMPRFLKLRVTTAEDSSSSFGSTRSSASMTVTFAPNDAYTSANSIPTAPAPITASDSGILDGKTALSELHTRSPSNFRIGRSFAREPVAMITFFASSTRSPSSPLTATLPLPASRPQPLTCSILFFLNRYATPLAPCSATFFARLLAVAMSSSTLPTLMPKSARSPIRAA